MGNSNGFSSKKIALSGILTALSSAVLLLENISPTGKLGFYVLSAFLLSVVIMECGLTYGWVSYIAISLISLLIVPEKTAVFPYIMFFGIYALVKSHIERLDKLVFEWILKFAFFNVSLYFLWNIAVNVLQLVPGRLFELLPVAVIIIVLQILFFLFDWLFSLWTQYYIQKIQSKIRRNF
ncbi:MAG: hypothetical protein GX213_14185 [Clostridiaceae bacterium]|nr:hypothetical protein [Clostridiaceae bacterium]